MIKTISIGLAVTLLLAGCASSSTGSTTNSYTSSGNAVSFSGKTYSIDMTKDGFVPDAIVIKTGDKVEFTNKDSKDHWPASNDHPTHRLYPGSGIDKCGNADQTKNFDSCGRVPPGSSYSFIFSQSGSWSFHDHLKPQNFGTITVK